MHTYIVTNDKSGISYIKTHYIFVVDSKSPLRRCYESIGTHIGAHNVAFSAVGHWKPCSDPAASR